MREDFDQGLESANRERLRDEAVYPLRRKIHRENLWILLGISVVGVGILVLVVGAAMSQLLK